MLKLQKQIYLWFTAGAIFLFIGAQDIFFVGASDKSGLIVFFEVIAGLGFILVAMMKWRKSKDQKTA